MLSPARLLSALVVAVLALTLAPSPPASADNPVTPGDITGYGFDQCFTQDQKTMNRWMSHSPFLAVGVYISGDSRACRDQPNLTPTWVRKQLRKGWRILPITLGPQASCQPRFPRYDDDFKISTKRNKQGQYARAWNMGVREAAKAVRAARQLGIVPGSTLFYDLEGYDVGNFHCRESSLVFLSGWTAKIHQLRYVSGVYSSASSGIKALDDARVERPGKFILPDQIWLARWDGQANTDSTYLRADGWRPGGRLKQYLGGHDEVWGGKRINIDSNYLDLGRGSVGPRENRCGGVNLSFRTYKGYSPSRNASAQVKALQCVLREKGFYKGKLTARYNGPTVAAAKRFKAAQGRPVEDRWRSGDWGALWAMGSKPVQKFGSSGYAALRVQRALNSLYPKGKLRITGVIDTRTVEVLRQYQSKARVNTGGVVARSTWSRFAAGRRS